MQTILVTGGAGYIGSHMVKMLAHAGYTLITLDDLSNGHADAVLAGKLVEGNTGDVALVEQLFAEHDFAGVMHFASFILVGESMQHPEKYFYNNVENARILAEVTAQAGIPFIFSSTAAVFGNPDYTPIDESHPKRPINPYGESKLRAEEMLAQLHSTDGLNYGVLRYFNAAGADPAEELGERHEPETHLIPLVLQTAHGQRDQISIFGEDYDTFDGTCIRDYIHIVDLCDAHLKLLEYLQNNGEERDFNLGTGQGYSVREVIDTAEKITGQTINQKVEQRREGDPAILIADGKKARELLCWKPNHSSLETILEHAWAWEKKSRRIGESRTDESC